MAFSRKTKNLGLWWQGMTGIVDEVVGYNRRSEDKMRKNSPAGGTGSGSGSGIDKLGIGHV